MSNDLYDELSASFCGLLTPEEATAFKETGNFSVDGIDFTLVYAGQLSPDVVYVMCDLGPLGKVDEMSCYRRMLEVNFFFVYQFGPQMAVHPETGMPVFISRLPLEGLTPELLMVGVRGTVQLAKQWQSGEFSMPIAA